MVPMTAADALRIVQFLADGLDPDTARPLPPESMLDRPDVVGALQIAVRALERLARRENRDSQLPEKAGWSWHDEEDHERCHGFDSGLTVEQLAAKHKRTDGAIRSRLQKLGRLTA